MQAPTTRSIVYKPFLIINIVEILDVKQQSINQAINHNSSIIS
jgi:hypothetical protein